MAGEYQAYVKKTKDFLKQLPPGYREKALANYDRKRIKMCFVDKFDVNNIARAIDLSMNWLKTPEGQDFWSKVHEAARHGTLDKLPMLK